MYKESVLSRYNGLATYEKATVVDLPIDANGVSATTEIGSPSVAGVNAYLFRLPSHSTR